METPNVLARAIGWASLGAAVASLTAPRPISRLLGYGDRPALVRSLGVRDLVVGAGLVVADDPAPWLRARLTSEITDVALHSAGAATGRFAPARAVALAAAAAAIAAVDYALLLRVRR